jgi:hypothetical protein
MNCSHNLNGTSATVPKDHGAVMAACGALQSARISGLPETPADLWDALTGFDLAALSRRVWLLFSCLPLLQGISPGRRGFTADNRFCPFSTRSEPDGGFTG